MLTRPIEMLSEGADGGRPSHRWQRAAACVVLLMIATHSFAQDWIYTARPGDNLWAISQTHLIGVEYLQRLQEYNGIADPDQISPGMKIRMPIAWLKRQPSPAVLIELRGSVERASAEGGATGAVTVGAILNIGDRIATGDESSATIRFADGSRILLQSNTELTLDTMSAYGSSGMVDTSMRLHGGRVENDVPPAPGTGTRYRIITPAAVAAVRGTSFRVAFDPAAATTLGEVLDGELGVSAAGVTRAVPAGFGVATRQGEPPGEPTQLLPAPDLSALPSALPEQRIVFEWPAVQDASLYRGQVFARPGTERLLQEAVVTLPRVQWQTLPVGEYLLRLRGVDVNGLEGLNADHAFSIEALPLPPVAMSPDDGAALPPSPLVLEWMVPSNVAAFHLQVARSLDFSDIIVDDPQVRDWRYRLPDDLAPGSYFWRLASVGREGAKGPFGDASQFRVRVAPATPAIAGASSDWRQLSVSWRPVAGAAIYRLQLARQASFSPALVDEQLEETRFSVSGLARGTYHVRVRAIGDDGLAGAFGAATRVDVPGWPLPHLAIAMGFAMALLLVLVLRRR